MGLTHFLKNTHATTSVKRNFLKQKALLHLLFVALLLGGQQVKGQILYGVNTASLTNYFSSYDVTTGIITTLPDVPGKSPALVYQLTSDGTYIYALTNTGIFRFTTGTNVWNSLASSNIANVDIVYLNGKMYGYTATGGVFQSYDMTAGTTTTLAPLTSNTFKSLTTDGTNIYAVSNSLGLYKYNVSADTWAAIETTNMTGMYYIAYLNGKIYATTSITALCKVYNLATGVVTNLAGSGDTQLFDLTTDGTNFFNINSLRGLKKYTVSSNTWSAHLPFMGKTVQAMYATPSPCTVSATATATEATCTGLVANSDGKLTLTAHSGGATKVGYSIGSSYSGPDFNSATTLTSAPFVVTSTLVTPSVNQPYTIRIFKDATCFADYSVMLTPKKCATADLQVTVTTSPQTGNQGETLTYTVTAKNNGPDSSPSVIVDMPIPSGLTYLNGTASQGSYSTVTNKWEIGNMANGASQTLVLSLKVN